MPDFATLPHREGDIQTKLYIRPVSLLRAKPPPPPTSPGVLTRFNGLPGRLCELLLLPPSKRPVRWFALAALRSGLAAWL